MTAKAAAAERPERTVTFIALPINLQINAPTISRAPAIRQVAFTRSS
jgi:hypothetical protein